MQRDDFRYRTVERHIMSLVQGEVLRPGEKLPSLRSLSGQLGVSISTVNHAYMELEKKGVLESRERSGFYLSAGAGQMPAPASRPRPALIPTISKRSDLIQNVLEALGNPGLLPFAVVCPDETLLPAKTLAKITASTLRNKPAQAMDYAPVNGNIDLRKQIALRSLAAGISVSPEEVLITSGALEGVAIALRALTRPGDNVLIQSPSYFCFLQLLENCGLRAIEIPSSTTGIDPQDIQNAIDQFDIRAAILVPNFNNPDGSLTSDSAKEEIVNILAGRNIPLVEDDVYGDLYFGDKRPTTCKSFDQKGDVIFCSSFSKTIAPGYRVGWMIPGRHFSKALEVKTTTNICTAAPNQMVIATFLQEGYYERHLRRLRNAIKNEMESLLLSLSRHFSENTRAGFPEGGATIWVELPEQINAVEYFHEARKLNIGIAPGTIFSTQDKYNNFIRLSCTGIWNHKMEKGVEQLGQLAKRMIVS